MWNLPPGALSWDPAVHNLSPQCLQPPVYTNTQDQVFGWKAGTDFYLGINHIYKEQVGAVGTASGLGPWVTDQRVQSCCRLSHSRGDSFSSASLGLALCGKLTSHAR